MMIRKNACMVAALLLLCFVGHAQTDVQGNRVIVKNALFLKDWWITGIQRDTSAAGFGDAGKVPTAQAVKDYVSKVADSVRALSTVGLATKVNTADTAAMLLPYARVQRLLDSVTNIKTTIGTKTNTSDTAAMLLPYARVQRLLDSVTNIKTSIGTKTNTADTAAMLLPYARVQRLLDSVTNIKTSIGTKQNVLTLSTTGTSGASTLVGSTLNIPQYSGSNLGNSDLTLTGPRTLTLGGNSLTLAGSSTSSRFHSDGNLTIGGIVNSSTYKLDVVGGDAQFNNIRVGLGAGGVLTNTALGYQALNTNTIGNSDVAVGYQALKNGNNHQYTVAVGYGALANSASNNSNTAIGYNSMGVTTATGQGNTCVGAESGKNLTNGYNAFFGMQTGINSTNTSENAAFGANAFYYNSTGARNAAFGHQSLYRSTGSDNTASGYYSLQSMTSGVKNTALGGYAGDKYGTGTNINTASNNSIFIGYDTRPLGLTQTNQVVIGFGSTGLGDNTTVLGNTSTTSAAIAGALAVQTGTISAPVASAQLEVISTTKGFLPPRMTTTQRTSISATPAEGLCVYDLTLHKLYVYDGTAWQAAW